MQRFWTKWYGRTRRWIWKSGTPTTGGIVWKHRALLKSVFFFACVWIRWMFLSFVLDETLRTSILRRWSFIILHSKCDDGALSLCRKVLWCCCCLFCLSVCFVFLTLFSCFHLFVFDCCHFELSGEKGLLYRRIQQWVRWWWWWWWWWCVCVCVCVCVYSCLWHIFWVYADGQAYSDACSGNADLLIL